MRSELNLISDLMNGKKTCSGLFCYLLADNGLQFLRSCLPGIAEIDLMVLTP
ncbi:MAG: hypothetical protein KK926_05060 [Methanomethylovorans sp.]|nr:hypothetical protein [Methanomethylovorans sp.]